jgi:diguanylate cyclase (GGDEF)-like protein/PAS domain S-box-containing protein
MVTWINRAICDGHIRRQPASFYERFQYMKLTFLKFPPEVQLTAIFLGTSLLMIAYEFLKSMLFSRGLTPLESDAITVFATASFVAGAAYFMRQWVVKLDERLRIETTAFEAREGILVTDSHGVIFRVNRTFTRITGYSADEVMGKKPNILSSGHHEKNFYKDMWESINRSGNWEGEVWNRRKCGEIYPEYLTITAVKNQEGMVTNYVATFNDITASKAVADEVKHLEFYDPLTGLPNRRLSMDRLQQAFAYSERSGLGGALLVIDLDNFNTLNDSLGHDMGDLLLQQVATRLESCVREGDTVARLGGDEFVVILQDLNKDALESAAQTETVGEKILAMLKHPYQLTSHKYYSTTSIGAVIFNDHNQSGEELLKQADIAMCQAKKAGRNTMRFFDTKMQDVINARVSLERELRTALEKRQFHLYYQIQVGIGNEPLGAEALIRWLHPERGMVPPLQFIPLAEETGLILDIGVWVLETACAQLSVWRQDASSRDLVLAINVSARQFRQADFVSHVQASVQRHAIDATRLKLELTESLLLESIEDTIATMNALKAIGVQLSLDDFGTGYSSLQYLKRLPLDQLKIDQSFVRDIVDDSSDQAIVHMIIAMACSLNLNVIAEGVETDAQRELLFNKGCRYYQGYLFGKPMPIELFDAKFCALKGGQNGDAG